ncbi:MAG: pyridoxamine 5'-phosphate oxidase family protein [Acidimicrobiia bacterium]|nr:pyridoxamine 5'-phosphate oxidase family protein [Acidimicrobiia bacterium]
MTSWTTFATEAPRMAQRARDRFTHHKHVLLATLRANGSPRISGIELWFWEDDAWLGMMPNSAKGTDLDRDPRFELHSAPTDLDLQEPDARIRGRAIRIEEEATIAEFAATLPHPAPTSGEMALYRIELAGAVLVSVEGDQLVIETWRPGSPSHRQSRR